MRTQRIAAWAAAALALTMVAGCRVETQKHGNGDDVSIQTPFGGMQVKTDDRAVLEKIGLPEYPGAQLEKQGDKNSGSADVDMSFGNFQLRVLAASYRTSDPPDKVEAFYRSGLRSYGDIVACQGEQPVGSPARTSEGLTCDTHKGVHWTTNSRHDAHLLELKAGSERHQHLVTIDPDGGGTKIGLVALDLPTDNGDNEGGDRQ